MPRVTGLAVIAGLSARVGTILPIIVMSALILPVPPVWPVVFLQKPFDLEELTTLVGTMLRHE